MNRATLLPLLPGDRLAHDTPDWSCACDKPATAICRSGERIGSVAFGASRSTMIAVYDVDAGLDESKYVSVGIETVAGRRTSGVVHPRAVVPSLNATASAPALAHSHSDEGMSRESNEDVRARETKSSGEKRMLNK